MIVQFFNYGSGLSKGPLDYLLGKDRAREHAKILSGDEYEVAGLIDSSPYTKKYTSGCLSFYENDLTDEAKNELMRKFEQCLFPGMHPSQYRVLWIEHKDKLNEETGERRLELNFLIPNVEIQTGQRLQPFYHESDLSRVDLFKKVTNYEYGLRDPNDPEHQQATTLKKNLPKKIKEFREKLDYYAEQEVIEGGISDRESMKKWLVELGYEITKEAPLSISIKNPYGDEKRPIRLTGEIYEQNFRAGAEGTSIKAEASARYRAEARERYKADLQRYRDHLEGKGEYLKQKYQQRDAELEKAGQPSHERAKDPNFEQQRVSEKTAERSHERDYRANYNRQEDVAESTYTSNERTSGSPQEASREFTGELARVEPLASRDSTASDFEKSPYYLNFSVDFSSLYSSYCDRQSWLSKQRKIQRVARLESKERLGRSEIGRSPESTNYEQTRSTEKISSTQIQGLSDDELRNAVIEDHRRTAAAIEAATAAAEAATASAVQRLADFRDADRHNQSAAEANKLLGEEKQGNGADRQTLSRDCEEALRTNGLRAFFRGFTDRVKGAFKDVIDEVSQLFRPEKGGERLDTHYVAEPSASRAREANQATNREDHQENGLSRAISRQVSGFNTGSIFKALDDLDRRRELQLEQQRRNEMDSGYDGPSF